MFKKKFSKRFAIKLIVVVLLVFGIGYILDIKPEFVQRPSISPTQTVTLSQELNLAGDNVYEVSDSRLIISASVNLRDNSKLIVKNSIIDVRQDFDLQYRLNAYDDSAVEMENVIIDTSQKWQNFYFSQNSNLIAKNVYGVNRNLPWYVFIDNAHVSIENTTMGFYVSPSSVEFEIVGSDIWGELALPENVTADLTFKKGITESFVFPGDQVSGVDYKISAQNTLFRAWSINVLANSDVTIRDTEDISISFRFRENAVVEMSNLSNKHYDYQSFQYDDIKFRLVNSTVTEWYGHFAVGGKSRFQTHNWVRWNPGVVRSLSTTVQSRSSGRTTMSRW